MAPLLSRTSVVIALVAMGCARTAAFGDEPVITPANDPAMDEAALPGLVTFSGGKALDASAAHTATCTATGAAAQCPPPPEGCKTTNPASCAFDVDADASITCASPAPAGSLEAFTATLGQATCSAGYATDACKPDGGVLVGCQCALQSGDASFWVITSARGLPEEDSCVCTAINVRPLLATPASDVVLVAQPICGAIKKTKDSLHAEESLSHAEESASATAEAATDESDVDPLAEEATTDSEAADPLAEAGGENEVDPLAEAAATTESEDTNQLAAAGDQNDVDPLPEEAITDGEAADPLAADENDVDPMAEEAAADGEVPDPLAVPGDDTGARR